MSRPAFDERKAHKPVFQALLDARAQFGGDTVALVDGDERELTYDDILRGSFALGSALKPGTRSRRMRRRDAADRSRGGDRLLRPFAPLAACPPC